MCPHPEKYCKVLLCGAVYCETCMVNLYSNDKVARLGDLPSCSCLKCHRAVNGSDRQVEVPDADLLSFLRLKMQRDRFSALCTAVRKGRDSRPCPSCKNTIVIGTNSKVYICSNMECINPEYGYCVKCDKGISDPSTHTCEDDDSALRQYLADNPEAVHPCPKCGDGLLKVPDTCIHVSCQKCKGTDGNSLRYCGGCGYIYPLNSSGSATYSHRCRASYDDPSGNVYRMHSRDLVIQRYIGNGAGPSSG